MFAAGALLDGRFRVLLAPGTTCALLVGRFITAIMKNRAMRGADNLPARILKHCAKQLAMPIAILVMRILMMGVWPDTWRTHWVIPLYKKGSSFMAKNYRGIHLTAQISKVAERLVKRLVEPFMERTVAYGPN